METLRKEVKKKLPQLEGHLLSGPLLVIVHLHLPAPKGMRKNRELADGLPHIERPDGDNLEKFLNDSLNGVLWDDDSRIAWMVRSKSVTIEKEGWITIFAKEIPYTKPNYQDLLKDIQEHINVEKHK